MTDYSQMWISFSAIAIPVFLSVLMQSGWSARVKHISAVAAAVAFTIAGLLYQGTFTWRDPAIALTEVYVGSQGVYLVMKNLGLAGIISKATDRPTKS